MRRILGGLLILSLAGCGIKLPGQPNPADREKLPDEITDFGTLFSHNCTGCHGKDGRVGPAPPLNDALFLAIVPDDEVAMVVRQGRAGTMMPGFRKSKGGPLTDKQIDIVAAGLRKKWGKSAVTGEGAPTYLAKGSGDPEAGKKVYATACAGCHGKEGQGTQGAGAINDPAFLGLMSDQALRRLIITGRPDLGMPNYAEAKGRGKEFKPLTEREVGDLTAYVAGWRQSAGGK